MKLQKLTFLLGCLLALLAAVPAAAQDAPPPLTYTVRPGDALPALAARFGTDTATVARLNSLQDPRRIYPGQRLIFPANSHPAYAWRPLAAGETLSSLARRAGMPWEDLARANTLL
ncbi:MAG TPA: LysM peptidoglycan-binding domain-containing protein, partial [Anaerolineae bacterium]|nr:LysM peptidoglycan-binding domain-containing protein [Anaerolineae bacterium]